MNGGSSASVDKLVGDNYSYWKLYTPQNGEARRKWKIKCGKALFALRTPTSMDYIDHVRNVQSPKEAWETLDRLFTQTNTMRLQFLENELAGTIQNKLTISEYFLKVKSLCSEISELDAEGVVKEAQLRRYLIRGLREEFMPFISSIQGWVNQPSIIELENLLSNQEALVKQIIGGNRQSSSRVEEVLYAKDKGNSKFTAKSPSAGVWVKSIFKLSIRPDSWVPRPIAPDRPATLTTLGKGHPKKSAPECYRCGKLGHIKRNCRVKVKCERCGKTNHIQRNCRTDFAKEKANVAYEHDEYEQPKWDQCLSIEDMCQDKVPKPVADADTRANVSLDYNYEWSLIRDALTMQLEMIIYSHVFDVSLDDVYHIPGLKKNLALVPQIADSGRYVLFGQHDVKTISNIKHLDADVLFKGKRKDSLYVLSANEAYIEKKSQYASATLWHARLGHVGFQLLQKISEKKLLEGVPQFKKIYPDVVCSGTEPCPYELLYHHKPNVSLFRVLGSICYVYVSNSNRNKLDPKAKRCIFIGYDTHRKGWRCMDPEIKKVVVSRDVVFDEISSDHIGANDKSITADLLPICGDAESNDKRSITTSGENVQQSETIEARARRSDRQRRPPTHLADYEVEVNLSSMIYVFLMGESCDDELKSYDDAKYDPKRVAAMKEEFLALIRNCT
ncbi:hypothetical protein SASPL_115341 [Salvia splendens]|uniref:CCHC-type domain-containing protein n=1 Tax=Salvia splendens TaxID=180675 RepID=A0A8X9A1I6_SALSN|nr:hypothetical protein SASPL_115341 [Salvia splendens]